MKNAKPIISLVDSLDNGVLGKVKNFSVERNNPDEIKITYHNLEKGNAVVFKEFYNKNWLAKDLDSGEKLKVVEAGPGLMAVYPNENSKGIELYYQKNSIEWFSILLSLASFVFLILFWKSKKFGGLYEPFVFGYKKF